MRNEEFFLRDHLNFTNSVLFGTRNKCIHNHKHVQNEFFTFCESHETEVSDPAGSFQPKPTARALLTMQEKGQVGPGPGLEAGMEGGALETLRSVVYSV